MDISSLDLLFPYIVFGYGVLAVVGQLLLEHLLFKRQPQQLAQLPPEWLLQLQKHRLFALLCLIIGSLWSLQNWLI